MNLREKLQLAAKEKIIKQQRSNKDIKNNTQAKISKSRVIKTIKKQKTFFPEIPVGFFEYKRPAEASFKSQKLEELVKKFNEKNNNKKEKINKVKFGLVSANLINAVKNKNKK